MKNILKEDLLVRPEEVVLDFSMAKDIEPLDESWLRMFGFWTKLILRKMFGEDLGIPVKLKGKKRDVESFYKALVKEKTYLKTYKKYGLDDPRTYKTRYKLESAVSDFERKTGLKWPFK